MATNEFVFSPSQILQPAQPSALNRLSPAVFGASQTFVRGQAVGQKTSDKKFYPMNLAATDGTQVFAGFCQYTFGTDASGNVYNTVGGTAGPAYFSIPSMYSNIYTGGIFDPRELTTAVTAGAVTAEVDTFTPATVTTGDVNTVYISSGPDAGQSASFTIAGTQTAAAAVTGLTTAWNNNPVLKALGTASGSATFIVTATASGVPLNLASSVNGTGTLTKVITTPATTGAAGEKDTFTLGGTVAIGDVYTFTVTQGGGQTYAVAFTATAATVANVTAGLAAAWSNSPAANNLAAATSTSTTVVLNNNTAGQSQSVALATTGSGTVSKAVTTAATGANIADILPGCPGARVLAPTGLWELP